MTQTSTITTRPSKTNSLKHQTLYSELMKEVRDKGLLVKKPSFYIIRVAIVTAIALASWVGVVALSNLTSNPWLNMLAAIPVVSLLGIMAAQYGFIAHEAAHRQVFNNNKINDAAGLILANLFAGMSYSYWLNKHNRHHAKPNQINNDPDIDIRVISFTTNSLENKKGIEHWLSKHQGKLFPVLLPFTSFDLMLDSFQSVFSNQRHNKRKFLEFGLMIVRQVTPIILLFMLFPIVQTLILWLVLMLSLGLFIGGAFAPNHKGMPLVPEDSKVDFLQRQILTSRNIRSSWITDNIMGGLNFQVEHHLFPSMPRVHLREAHRIVKRFCAERNIPFKETGLFESYSIIIKHLDKVGLSNNMDPFVCPMVAELRPRH